MICVYNLVFVLNVACNYHATVLVPDALMSFELV
jgi:hypothetical protein